MRHVSVAACVILMLGFLLGRATATSVSPAGATTSLAQQVQALTMKVASLSRAVASLRAERRVPGPRGAPGKPGMQGAVGAVGVQGIAGPQGPQGTQGQAGPAGPPGPSGPSGPAGAQGPTGASGTSAGTELAAGQTESGDVAAGFTAVTAPSSAGALVSFTPALSTAPSAVAFAGSSGCASPGSAPRGVLCLYAAHAVNVATAVTAANDAGQQQPSLMGADRHGFYFQITAGNAGLALWQGTYSYTAP